MVQPDWVPAGVDTEHANVARVYDALLGGTHNFAADRDLARAVRSVEPQARTFARMNRAYLGRAVKYLAGDAGVQQFLDIGSGIPTEGNVHEVAQNANPDARVVYIDKDPVAVAHSKAMLAGNDRAAAIQADLRQPEHILAHPAVRDLLDLTEPVAVLLVAILHFITDEENPAAMLERIRTAVVPGSYLAISHATTADRPDTVTAAAQAYQRASVQATPRPRQEILDFFAGFELVDPGVVYLPQWRPDSPDDVGDHPESCMMLAAVGRKVG